MDKETKFGYGFLLVGVGLPWLIEHLFGALWALSVSIVCLVAGTGFLWAAHMHREEGEPPLTIWAKIAAPILAVAVIAAIGVLGANVYFQHKTPITAVKLPSPSRPLPQPQPPPVVIQKSKGGKCDNNFAGHDVNVKC